MGLDGGTVPGISILFDSFLYFAMPPLARNQRGCNDINHRDFDLTLYGVIAFVEKEDELRNTFHEYY